MAQARSTGPSDLTLNLKTVCFSVVLAALCASATGMEWSTRARGPAAGALAVARSVRLRGCDGHAGTSSYLRGNAALSDAAERWAGGESLQSAVHASGYREEGSSALHVSGDAAALQQALSHSLCKALTDRSFIDIGAVERGRDTWIIIAAPFAVPAMADADEVRSELLLRINAARRQPRRCGATTFASVGPIRLDSSLNQAAQRHAQDMLARNYFAHEGRDGSTPATRVTATGYRYRIVGENIAFGPQSAAEAVQGWLASPGHCENIMDPRFSDTGIAFAASTVGAPRIYWVQDFATAR